MTQRTIRALSVVAATAALFAVAALGFGLVAPAAVAAQERPQPTCADRCTRHAQELLRKCEAAGGENCAARARAAYNECLAKCSTGTTPPACADRCTKHAQELLRKCEAAGGENCAARARAAYNECAAKCSAGDGAAQTCAGRCEKQAQEIMSRCEAAGGENCKARARKALAECKSRCDRRPGGR